MDILYGHNTFQFNIHGSKISFLRLVENPRKVFTAADLEELGIGPVNVCENDFYILRPSDPIEMDAIRMSLDEFSIGQSYRIVCRGGAPRIPQSALRRIRALNLNMKVVRDSRQSEKGSQDVTLMVTSGNIHKVLLTITADPCPDTELSPVLRGKWRDLSGGGPSKKPRCSALCTGTRLIESF
jgi:hypothetical protein